MPVRKGNALWEGGLKDGKGSLSTESGAINTSYNFSKRFENEAGTNPEELIAAAHAACFSMAFSGVLGKAGFTPEKIETRDELHLEKVNDAMTITRIDVYTKASVPGISEEDFKRYAEEAGKNCPVSRLLKAAEIKVIAELK